MTQYTIDSIVRGYLIDKGQDAMHEYPRALRAAITSLKDLHYDVSGTPKVEVLTVENASKATLPQDVIRVIRLGFSDSSGRFVEIFSDNNLIVNTPTNQNEVNQSEGTVMGGAFDSSLFRNGQSIGRWYGNKGGGAYTFRMDWERGLVEFSSNVSGQVIIEYLGDPNKIGAEYLVHPFLVEAIEYGIHYRMMKFKRSYSAGEKQMSRNDYLNAKHHARVRFASESMGNMINASRTTLNGSAKY
jgi:hypothetical protein|tara:strand:+ start:2319 stop:3047 length:729 start_codon:yes stop_codon:yes gene_type:complete